MRAVMVDFTGQLYVIEMLYGLYAQDLVLH